MEPSYVWLHRIDGGKGRTVGYLGVDFGGTTRACLIHEPASAGIWTVSGGNVALDAVSALRVLLGIVQEAAAATARLGVAGARAARGAAAWLVVDLEQRGRATLMMDAGLAAVAAFGIEVDGIVCAPAPSAARSRSPGTPGAS